MKNSFFLAIVAILLGFGVGYLVFGMKNSKKPETKIVKRIEIKKLKSEKDKSSESEETTDYSKELSGKFVLEGAEYAGFDFKSKKKVFWTNEIYPDDPDELQIRWIDRNTFMTIAERVDEQCPPGISLYRVISFEKGI